MPRLTLSMIVKNEERYLSDCLESVKNVADEIVLVDTGSTDRTIEIARQYGAKIFRFDWINDFSAARNFALQNSAGDWILYLDADERLEKESLSEIRKISFTNSRSAYFCTVKSLDRIEGRDNSMRYIRLFKNEKGIEFRGKVHEQISHSLSENNYRIFNSSISILHLGYNISVEEKKNKAERNLALLLEEYSGTKSDYFAYQLANTYNVLNDYDPAIKYFLISAASNTLAKNLRADSYCSLALIYHKKQNIQEAEKYLGESLRINKEQPFAYLLGAKIFLLGGNLPKAEEYCTEAFRLSQKTEQLAEKNEVLSRVDPEEVIYFGISAALLNKNIQSVQYYLNELIETFKRDNSVELALRISVLQKLFDAKNMDDAEKKCFEKMANNYNINLFASLLSADKDIPRKLELLRMLNNKHKTNSDVIKNLAACLDESGNTEEAIKLLEKNRDDKDPGMLLYLLSFYVKVYDQEKIKFIFSKISNLQSLSSEIKKKLDAVKSLLPAGYLN